MKIDADPNAVINQLLNEIAQLTRENAFYSVAWSEAQEKIKALEEKKNAK